MPGRVEVEGWPAVAAAMGRVPAACERAAERAAVEAARTLAAATAPRLPVVTGRLRASVAVTALDGGGAATVIGAPYAVYVPAARAMAATAGPAAADYARRTATHTDTELGRLPWP